MNVLRQMQVVPHSLYCFHCTVSNMLSPGRLECVLSRSWRQSLVLMSVVLLVVKKDAALMASLTSK